MARNTKAIAPGRDNRLLDRIAKIAKQPLCAGFTVNKEGLAAIRSELDDKGRLFGFGIFCVVPQKQRVLAWWDARDLDTYLGKFKLKGTV